MVMKISRICIWVLMLGTVMVFSSCANEHPKEQLDGNAMYGSASEIYNHTVSSLYQDIDFVEHSEEEDSLYAVWSHLYQVIGKANQSLDIIDYKSDLLSVNQKDQFKAEVRAIRAMMYYEAMELFGRIPVILSSGEAAIYEAASGIAVASLTDVNLCAQSERSEVFRFIFSELQQALPYLPNEHSANGGVYEGRITQPVINFLLAKLAFNAEIYTFDDWTRGYKKRPKGKKIHFVVQTADGASLLNGGTAGENRSKELNAWETCIFYCNRLADEGCSLEEDEIFNSSARYLMPKDALVMDEADSVLHSRPAKPLFRFRYADVLLMKAEAMERNDGDGRAEYNMVRAHAGLPARKSSLANILEDRQVVLAGETCHRQDLIRFGKFLKSSHLRRSVQSALSSSSIVFPIPQRSLAFNGKLVQNKGYEAME